MNDDIRQRLHAQVDAARDNEEMQLLSADVRDRTIALAHLLIEVSPDVDGGARLIIDGNDDGTAGFALIGEYVEIVAYVAPRGGADALQPERERLPILLERGDDGFWVASIPGTGALSQGTTREAALNNVISAIDELGALE